MTQSPMLFVKESKNGRPSPDSMEHLFFAVCLNEILIGYAAFHMREDGCEMGYCFHSDYHGKGYARESLSALILYILMLHPGTAITAGTALENLPSVKLLQALGFCQIGTERVSFYKDADGRDIFFEGGIFKIGRARGGSRAARIIWRRRRPDGGKYGKAV